MTSPLFFTVAWMCLSLLWQNWCSKQQIYNSCLQNYFVERPTLFCPLIYSFIFWDTAIGRNQLQDDFSLFFVQVPKEGPTMLLRRRSRSVAAVSIGQDPRLRIREATARSARGCQAFESCRVTHNAAISSSNAVLQPIIENPINYLRGVPIMEILMLGKVKKIRGKETTFN